MPNGGRRRPGHDPSRSPTFRFAHDALIDTNNHTRLGQIFGIDIIRH
jgi:hypothetical protein